MLNNVKAETLAQRFKEIFKVVAKISRTKDGKVNSVKATLTGSVESQKLAKLVQGISNPYTIRRSGTGLTICFK